MLLLEEAREVRAEIQAPCFGEVVRVEMRGEVSARHDGGAHFFVAEEVQRRVEVVDLRAPVAAYAVSAGFLPREPKYASR